MLLDEFRCLGNVQSFVYYIVSKGSGAFTEANIIVDASGEKNGFLGNETNAVIQAVESIFFHVYTIYENSTGCGVIQSGNQADQCGLAAAGSTDKGDGFALVHLEADIGKLLFRGAGIGERNIAEFHSACFTSLGFVALLDIGMGIQNFIDTACRYLSTGEHDEYHNEKHEG